MNKKKIRKFNAFIDFIWFLKYTSDGLVGPTIPVSQVTDAASRLQVTGESCRTAVLLV